MGNAIYDRPAELLRDLVRFNTTNPPGNEADCCAYIKSLLDDAGIETTMVAKSPDRPNLVARLKGSGAAPPLLMYGHMDVVTTDKQDWSVDPFEGVISNGFLWGRGALDMKGGIAMMLAALLRAKAEGTAPAGDVVFAALSDEEAGGEYGAKFLVESHPEIFKGIRYAVGEFGGFPMYYGGKRFYAIQVSEKQICWLKATLRGPGGHGSLPMRGGAMAKLAEFLKALNEARLPVHIDPIVRRMLETMAAKVPAPDKEELVRLLDPKTTDGTLDKMGRRGLMLDAMTHNVVNATVVRGGSKINVIPSEVTLEIDGRTLPGFTPDDIISELRGVVGDMAELELVRHDEGPSDSDMGLFDTLDGILRASDPGSVAVPLLIMGCTDARFLARLGVQSYGFIPMNLPEDFDFLRVVHAADERIPLQCLDFGAAAIYELLQRYGK